MIYTNWARLAAPGETRVPRHTLELRYDGGPTVRFFIVVPPGEIGNPVPDVVYVNTAPVRRER
jgi:hypothetical protein